MASGRDAGGDGLLFDPATEFPLDAGIVYLDHAAVAPLPRRAAEAACAFAREAMRLGAARYEAWLETEARLRRHAAALFCCAPEDVALVKNTSEGLSLLAFGLDWRAGEAIVHCEDDFPSNRIVWEAAAERFGLTRRAVAVSREPDPEEALIAAMEAGPTRLLAVSSVHYATGLRLDLARLGAACAERGVLLCVDAIQSLGALGMDVRAWGIHWAVADGHKWLLGPEGCGLLYADPGLRERLALLQYGWHMTDRPGDFEARAWHPRPDAARFEPGSPNLLGIHALEASLALLLEAGIPTVERNVIKNASYLSEELSKIEGVTFASPADPARRSGIVSFRLATSGATRALHANLREHGVICAHRAGNIRFSPHFYTSHEALDSALALVRELVGAN